MRVFKDRFYVCRTHPGISGFKRWDEWEYYVVSGLRAQGRDRVNIYGEFRPGAGHTYRLGDGHLPDYQPRVNSAEAVTAFLTENPYAEAVVVNGGKVSK